jgi:hypothetical protein
MWVIGKEYAFHLDWRLFFKNIIVICVLCGMMWWLKLRAASFVEMMSRWSMLRWL